MIDTFAEKGAKISPKEFQPFKDRLVETEFDAIGDAVHEQMAEWRKEGSDAEQNMARLFHTLAQGFHMGPMSQPILMCLKDFGEDSPYRIAGLEGNSFKQAGEKAISIRFNEKEEVEVEHRVAIKQMEEEGADVSITMRVNLKASLDHLDDWDYSLHCTINPQTEKSAPAALKILEIYNALNIPVSISRE